MIPFDLAEPTSLKEAMSLLDPDDGAIRRVAGGTALMLMMKAGVFQPTRRVSLQHIEKDYATIAKTKDGALRIGAMATLTQVEHICCSRLRKRIVEQIIHHVKSPLPQLVANFFGDRGRWLGCFYGIFIHLVVIFFLGEISPFNG